MDPYHAPLLPGNFYHVLNRGNNQENIFLTDDNYRYFLKKWEKYILPYTEILAYCLMPNHFHFLIRVKPEKEILSTALENLELSKLRKFIIPGPANKTNREAHPAPNHKTATSGARSVLMDVNRFMEERFQRCFGSYVQAFNKKWNRNGSLLQKRFKRILVDSEYYLSWLIHYIHHNPIHHHFTSKCEAWKFSSYNAIVSTYKTSVNRDFVINWFGSVQRFIEFHKKEVNYDGIERYLFEENPEDANKTS